jgi:hypothetical protein
MFLAVTMHSRIASFALFALCGLEPLVRHISKLLFTKKNEPIRPKKPDRELTAFEVIAWFTIGFSALYLVSFIMIMDKGLLNNIAFMIPMGMGMLAIRLLAFAKAWGTLRPASSASN